MRCIERKGDDWNCPSDPTFRDWIMRKLRIYKGLMR